MGLDYWSTRREKVEAQNIPENTKYLYQSKTYPRLVIRSLLPSFYRGSRLQLPGVPALETICYKKMLPRECRANIIS